ncbi:glycogen debranching protein GlgX [Pedobacter sp. Leaf176]|uniref:glycogen debranching protein GlgX n=1 Tax=Pedobacter sp. Leaf176 TaxID=1736286 RepID=UPI0006FB6D5F|nr:glycogen debranching protein GlgX [Pedobacter sp. Leaf176]KQR71182.1 glycogen debranching protein [Pedobacter sp. Leaf176]
MKQNYTITPGKSYPLGATWMGNGTNFSLFAENAEKVELCLFNNENNEVTRLELADRDHQVFHCFINEVAPGALYGYRVYGPYVPEEGKRFNPNKLLLDPYAKAISGDMNWSPSVFGYNLNDEEQDLSFSDLDSASFVPKSVVVDPSYDWEGDVHPDISYTQTLIYELHVKGFSQLNQRIPENLRGTYAGIAHPDSVRYLKSLGVTAVELMPVHQFIQDGHLLEKGLSNYWGYNTIGFFAPHSGYSSSGSYGQQVKEFKDMVKALHKSGIEVILDVVYNHTAEGNQLGPTLCFKGIDNESYYRLEQDNKRYYTDYTGTGNTLNTRMPAVLRFIMDSLRYWINEMHVDGFRFDLASTLARGLHEVDRLGAFFDIIHQDPVISQIKLIAEPWDVGEDGYQVGKFPAGWAEWNGKYRDIMRRFWKGDPGMLGEFAQRFMGSPDLYMQDYRRPTASINFITAHDGFTLNDLVSYNKKHNEANQDDNTDGEQHNDSWNCGWEGDTDDGAINYLRNKHKRNFLATLLLSQGVPMICAGDELGKTQKGNNNAYCQDNEISWINWAAMDDELSKFATKVIHLRMKHPSLRRKAWITGDQIDSDGLLDIAWFSGDGEFMNEQTWNSEELRCLGIFLHGEGIQGTDEEGAEILDDHFLLIFNADSFASGFKLPEGKFSKSWTLVLATGDDRNLKNRYEQEELVNIEERSLVILKAEKLYNYY